MKAVFLTNSEIETLKVALCKSNNKTTQKVLEKIERADSYKTNYSDILHHAAKEAHHEVLAYFRKNKVNTVSFDIQICIVGESWIKNIFTEDGYIFAQCSGTEVHDISYSDTLYPIINFLRKQKKTIYYNISDE